MALRKDEYPGGQTYSFGDTCEVAEHDEWIVERIALGSDYPFPLGEAHPGELIESMPDFSPEEKTRLLSGSAREFLALH